MAGVENRFRLERAELSPRRGRRRRRDQVTQSSGYWLTFILTAAPLYLTYKMYRAGVESEARQGAILEAAHDAILTMDAQLNIREFNPAAEKMFGYARLDMLGRHVEMLLPDSDRAKLLAALTRVRQNGPRAAGAVARSN